MSKIVRKKFKIDGMHCTSCAMTIDFDLEDLGGVLKSNTSYAKQFSEIEYDENVVTDVKIIEVIKKTGYSAYVENI